MRLRYINWGAKERQQEPLAGVAQYHPGKHPSCSCLLPIVLSTFLAIDVCSCFLLAAADELVKGQERQAGVAVLSSGLARVQRQRGLAAERGHDPGVSDRGARL